MADAAPLLAVEGLSKSFRGLQALEEYAVAVAPGELVGVIGPNGAGKTTLFNLITGVVKPSKGQILFAGNDITGLRPDRIARQGLARTFQKLRLLQPLTAVENLHVALQPRHRVYLWDILLNLPPFKRSERELDEEAHALLTAVGIPTVGNLLASELSYGQQRRLELACALALRPRLLLLDEPAAGMNPTESDDLLRLIRELHASQQLTILLIEHNMRVVMNLCARIQVLNYGRIIAEGAPAAIREDPRVVEAYLGQPEAS